MNPAIKPYFKRPNPLRPHTANNQPWNIIALCEAYAWPKGAPGGVTIAIVELGGGWHESDLAAFFKSIGQPVPTVTDVSVDGTKNTPGSDADVEVALDIQIAAAAYCAATGKPADIRVYWAQDIATAVRAATKDGCSVCSISWGADEADWGSPAVKDMEAAAASAMAAGMIVFAASGDNDADDATSPPHTAVDCPACCPHVVGCSGTSKPRGAPESVWNNDPNPNDPTGEGTGGGYSTMFPAQPWQPPGGSGRIVPDVAANADPNTGYEIYCNGSPMVVGGTSAVAPLYAGLFASFGKMGPFVMTHLWAAIDCFDDITKGGNGLYKAAAGPDPCTGMGVPHGGLLEQNFVVSQAPPAPPPAPGSAPTFQQALDAFTAKVEAGAPLQDRSQILAAFVDALSPLWASS